MKFELYVIPEGICQTRSKATKDAGDLLNFSSTSLCLLRFLSRQFFIDARVAF